MSMPSIAALYVYPVKSLRGQAVDAAVVEERGLRHDRRWMVVDEDGVFLTQRTLPRMCRVAAAVREATLVLSADGAADLELPLEGVPGPTRLVVVWHDEVRAVDQGDQAADWLGGRLGVGCRLVRMADDHVRAAKTGDARVGFADAFPFLVISRASLEDLNARLDEPLPMNRFRPNIVIEGVDPYAEDTWESVRVGELRLAAGAVCERCATTATDQATAERGVEPLQTLVSYRRTPEGTVVFGRNFIHSTQGVTIRVGDAVRPG
jgi:hypothetical protein